MKTIIEFNLDLEEDKDAFPYYHNALNLRDALRDISNRLRNVQKYDHPPMTQEEFYHVLRDNGLGDLEI